MSRATPTAAHLGDLEPGQFFDCYARLVARNRKATRDGKQFFDCRFTDGRRTAAAAIWSDHALFAECETGWKVGECYKLRGTFSLHETYGPKIDLIRLRPVDESDRTAGFDPLQLLEHSRFDPDETLACLRTLVSTTIANRPLRQLVLDVLDRHAETLCWLPGSAKNYYPFAGGWLEHTLSVAHKCLALADLYRPQYPDLKPLLNRDLVVAGAVLHDIGRVAEIADPTSMESTVPGKLLGHLILGRDLVRDAARDVPDLNPELLALLEHLIVTHLVLPEWGSPRLPCIPECLILHHVDDLDAKMEMYVRCLTRDQSPGPFTDRDPVLGKTLLKSRQA